METFPELYPNCELRWVDSGHMMMYEKPEVVIDAITDIIEAV